MTDPAPSRRYHHGDLRNAMIEAAVELVAEEGAESVTIREVARRAGVSSGAPFRHFPNKAALMTAVAEDGMIRLRASVEARLAVCRSAHPLARLLAIGDGYFAWAVAHPTHYRVLGDRRSIDFWGSDILTRDNRWIREEMTRLFDEAARADLLVACDLPTVHLQCRALAYGLARMHVDAHFSEFAITPDAAPAKMRGAMEAFVRGLARDPAALRRALDEDA